jgi:hypothetical protein
MAPMARKAKFTPIPLTLQTSLHALALHVAASTNSLLFRNFHLQASDKLLLQSEKSNIKVSKKKQSKRHQISNTKEL